MLRAIGKQPVLIILLVLTVVGFGLSGAESAHAAEPKYGGTLTIIIPEDVRHLDTIFDGGTEGRYPGNQITDGLVNNSDRGEIVPGLAHSWEQVDDVTYI